MRRTRLGKIVGSYRPPLEAFTYWRQDGAWTVVAPSGARIETHATEARARASAERHNREWRAM